jgi:hypothetical protein
MEPIQANINPPRDYHDLRSARLQFLTSLISISHAKREAVSTALQTKSTTSASAEFKNGFRSPCVCYLKAPKTSCLLFIIIIIIIYS